MKPAIKKTIAICLLAILSLGIISSIKSDFEISKNLDIFASLYRELNQNYVDEVQPGELMKTAIDKMLESLDPYTVYIPESEIEDVKFMTTGQYGGIGALIQKQGEKIVISEPYLDSPSQKAGLKAGDEIITINKKTVENKDISDVSDMLKGSPNTKVEIEINRNGENKVFEITREEIKIDNIPYTAMVDPKVGYIKLNSFTMNAGNEVKQALLSLKEKNPQMEGIILDLRNNGGGLLGEAVNISNIFVDKGQLIVSTKGKLSDSNKEYRTLSSPTDKNIRLAVLVNGYSASASEIVAGSIQDLDRGVIIGQKSFGKGLVQHILDLPYNSKMKVTVAKYYIPSGRCIQAIDYSHKVDGKAIQYSDSLKKSFKTKNGRVVYDAGGILPDVTVTIDSMSEIAASLYINNHIFNFATDYAEKHSSIASADKFTLTNQEYNDFLKFISDKEYKYTTNTEESIKKLKEAAKIDKYDELLAKQISDLETAIKHNKEKDLETFKSEIIDMLCNEIVSRYYYQKGRIIYNLGNDKELNTAIEILKDQNRYQKIMSSGK